MKLFRKAATIISVVVTAGLHATEPQIPDGYYDSCEGLYQAGLLTALCNKISDHNIVSYSGLWSIYKTTDVDENGKIWDMYSSKRWTYSSEQCGNYTNVGDCYNREHSMPKSWFSDASPMVSDAFHIYPTDGKVNGQRSNYPYGECSGGTTLPSYNGIDALGKLGSCTFQGYTGIVFEPDDDYKGDFARSYFYMAAAYNDKIAAWTSSGTNLGGNSYPAFNDWSVTLLMKWHRQDPVSQKEIDRNEAVYSIQDNRNPFIDHPEMAEHIWGDQKTVGWSSSSTPVPTLQRPSAEEVLDFGIMAPNYTNTLTLNVKGSNLEDAVSITSSSSIFTVSASSVTADAANTEDGVDITVSCTPLAPGTLSETLTLTCGSITRTVTLAAEVISGIPVLPARNITETSFTARWTYLNDYADYTLDVQLNGTSLAGYPRSVTAADGQYEVTGLNTDTTYTYSLSSPSMGSNIVSVTTGAYLPSITITSKGNPVKIVTPADQHSLYREVTFETENITGQITVSVSEDTPFEVSADLLTWSKSITLTPDDDHFYVDVYSTSTGEFDTIVTISADGVDNDEQVFLAEVTASLGGRFFEDFEAADAKNHTSYSGGTYTGQNDVSWTLTNAWIWKDGTDRSRDTYSLRFGSDSTSSIETTSPKAGGIGTISFYGSYWSSSDGQVTLVVEYKPASAQSAAAKADSDWITAATITLNNTTLQPYSVPVNVDGDNYIRLRQTAGKRANIDDIEVTHNESGSVTSIDNIYCTESSWTACAVEGGVMVDNLGEALTIYIYSLDGSEIDLRRVSRGKTLITLEQGFYIVTDGDDASRVAVK